MSNRREFLAQVAAVAGAAILPGIVEASPQLHKFKFEMEFENIPLIKGKVFIYLDDEKTVLIEEMEAANYDGFGHEVLKRHPDAYAFNLYVGEFRIPQDLAWMWEKDKDGQWWCTTSDLSVNPWRWPSRPSPMEIREPIVLYCL